MFVIDGYLTEEARIVLSSPQSALVADQPPCPWRSVPGRSLAHQEVRLSYVLSTESSVEAGT